MQKAGRRIAREFVLKALYAYEMSRNPLELILNDIITNNIKDHNTRQFAVDLAKKAVEQHEELDKQIKKKAMNWDFERIAVLDKLILRMGICELMFFEDIPPEVTINEAIEIAKKYSTEKSGSFVNGILDSVLVDLKKSGKLRKTGRGLIDMPIQE